MNHAFAPWVAAGKIAVGALGVSVLLSGGVALGTDTVDLSTLLIVGQIDPATGDVTGVAPYHADRAG